MKEIYFDNIPTIGKLYLDKILNQFEEENIVFVCTDNKNNFYFAICYEIRNSLKWIICKTDSKTIALVLMKEIDLYSIFERSKTDFIQIIFDGIQEVVHFVSIKDINKNYLPTPGTFFREEYNLESYIYKLILEFNVFYSDNINSGCEFSEHEMNNFYLNNDLVFDSDKPILITGYDYSKKTKEFDVACIPLYVA